MKKIIFTLIFLTIASPLSAKEEIIFTGIPEIKISEGGTSRVSEKLKSAGMGSDLSIDFPLINYFLIN